eukprot:6490968-Amphidinium_carterae.1
MHPMQRRKSALGAGNGSGGRCSSLIQVVISSSFRASRLAITSSMTLVCLSTLEVNNLASAMSLICSVRTVFVAVVPDLVGGCPALLAGSPDLLVPPAGCPDCRLLVGCLPVALACEEL